MVVPTKRCITTRRSITPIGAKPWTRWKRFSPAAGFGENVSASGLLEADVAIGDTFRFGDTTIQVSLGRQPCWKLNERFGRKDMARRVQQSGRTGWYYRVLHPGLVASGDELRLIDRPHEDWPLTRLWTILYEDTRNVTELQAMVELICLGESWRSLAMKRLTTLQPESWSERLNGAELT